MDDENIFGDTVQSYSNDLNSTGSPFRKHVLICSNRLNDGCFQKGSSEIQKALFAQKMDHGLTDVKISSVQTLDNCDRGPTAVVYPDNVWYEGLTLEDVPRVVESHLAGDQPVSELTFEPDLPRDFHHIVVCTFLSNCGPEGGGERYKELVKLTSDADNVRVTQSHGCLKECSMGPICCVYPDGDWYAGLTESKAERIAELYTTGGDGPKYRSGTVTRQS